MMTKNARSTPSTKLDDPENIEDKPYFYEDRPPTPVYIPKHPGCEIATQIEDGEIFDFDLEVQPILQVLIGGSLIQAKYELIEEHEREEYSNHKKDYEQKSILFVSILICIYS